MAATKTVRDPVKCARPGCRNQFIPAHGKHLYCSNRCKRCVQNYRHALNGGR